VTRPFDPNENPRLVDGRAVYLVCAGDPAIPPAAREMMSSAPGGWRSFVCAWDSAPVAADLQRAPKTSDFTEQSLRWLIERSTLLNCAAFDPRRQDIPGSDLVKLLLDLDHEIGTDDHARVVTLITNSTSETGDFGSLCRPFAQVDVIPGSGRGPGAGSALPG
jgi:hypothetical protein